MPGAPLRRVQDRSRDVHERSDARHPEAHLLVDFEPDASLLDQVDLIHDLESLLGIEVDVISTGGLRPRHDPIREEAVDLDRVVRRWVDEGASEAGE